MIIIPFGKEGYAVPKPALRPAARDRLTEEEFFTERAGVLASWPTGQEADLDEAVAWHRALPEAKAAPPLFRRARQLARPLVYPRTGVASLARHLDDVQQLYQAGAELLCTHADSYTRTRRFEEGQRALEESLRRDVSLLNGVPVVNYGARKMREVAAVTPIANQFRQGTPEGRLASETVYAAGYRSMLGGILGSVPHMRDMPIGECIRNWQYVDRLVGEYESRGVSLHREYYGALMGMVMPPSLMCTCLVLDALLAAQQGVRHLSLGLNNNLHLRQDVAAIKVLDRLVREYLDRYGFTEVEATPVLHMWMGPFPPEPAKAYSLITLGAFTAAYAGAAGVIVKTADEAIGCPSTEANVAATRLTRACVEVAAGQHYPDSAALAAEMDQIEVEARQILEATLRLGDGAIGPAIEEAFAIGYIDIPLAPAKCNAGRAISVRDSDGAVRYLDCGNIPFSDEVKRFNAERVRARATAWHAEASYKLVLHDFSAKAFEAPPLDLEVASSG
jgi:methylaspartate mutase epsilon subunit